MPKTCCYCQILNRFPKNMKMSGVMEIGTMAAELFRVDGHTDRQTDRHDKAKSRFPQFFERGYKQEKWQWTNPVALMLRIQRQVKGEHSDTSGGKV
jgi:hypothetical protein